MRMKCARHFRNIQQWRCKLILVSVKLRKSCIWQQKKPNHRIRQFLFAIVYTDLRHRSSWLIYNYILKCHLNKHELGHEWI